MMDDNENPAATVPAHDAPASGQQAPVEQSDEPSSGKPGGPADDDASSDYDIGDAVDDDDQDDDKEDDADDGDEEREGESEGDRQKRKSRAERYRQQVETSRKETAALRAENAALRNRTGGSLPTEKAQLQRAFDHAVWQEVGDPPNEKDFGENYVGYTMARQAWETDRRQVAREVKRRFESNFQEAQNNWEGLVDSHKNRVERFKSTVKDYDEVMRKATRPVADHVQRQLLHSKKSAALAYVLARNDSKLAQLNRMPPEEAAREIGRLEGRLSQSSKRSQTKARKPVAPLRGTGTSPPSQLSAINAWMKKTYGDRA